MLICQFVSIKFFSFLILVFNILIQTILLVILTSLEKQSVFHKKYHYDSIVCFFLRNLSSFCFFFSFCSNKIVKLKCKTPFSKLLYKRLYLLYISNIRHSKLRGLQKYMLLKKLKTS